MAGDNARIKTLLEVIAIKSVSGLEAALKDLATPELKMLKTLMPQVASMALTYQSGKYYLKHNLLASFLKTRQIIIGVDKTGEEFINFTQTLLTNKNYLLLNHLKYYILALIKYDHSIKRYYDLLNMALTNKDYCRYMEAGILEPVPNEPLWHWLLEAIYMQHDQSIKACLQHPGFAKELAKHPLNNPFQHCLRLIQIIPNCNLRLFKYLLINSDANAFKNCLYLMEEENKFSYVQDLLINILDAIYRQQQYKLLAQVIIQCQHIPRYKLIIERYQQEQRQAQVPSARVAAEPLIKRLLPNITEEIEQAIATPLPKHPP